MASRVAKRVNTFRSGKGAHPSPLKSTSSSSRSSTQFFTTLGEYEDSITKRVRKPDENRAHDFITNADLRDFWNLRELENFFFKVVKVYLNEIQIQRVNSSLFITLSILINMRWGDWPNFTQIFLAKTGKEWTYTDEMIKDFTPAELENNFQLGDTDVLSFQSKVPMFYPIVIKKWDTRAEYSTGQRMPFLSGSQSLGGGAQGAVTSETIPPGQFVYEDGKQRNTENKVVACKTFHNEDHFSTESANLRMLLSDTLSHHHILIPTAMITVENRFMILSDIADFNLEVFLQEKMSDEVTLQGLIGQGAKLAGALKFLYKELDEDKLGSLYHMDLKPENILIQKKRPRGGETGPEGHWLIADFGISKWSRKIEGKSSGTSLERGPGTYQPPEVEKSGPYSEKSEVWSLGCILVRIVCRKVLGVDQLLVFDQARRIKESETRESDYFYHGEVLNPAVSQLLGKLVSTEPVDNVNHVQHDKAMDLCHQLLKEMLNMEKGMRPEAKRVKKSLIAIQKELLSRKVMHHRVRSFANQLAGNAPPFSYFSQSVKSTRSSSALSWRERPSEERSRVQEVPEEVPQGAAGHLIIQIKQNVPQTTLIHCLENEKPSGEELNQLVRERGEDVFRSVLSMAAEMGHNPLVRELIRLGANTDLKDGDGRTPLMHACRKGRLDTVDILLENGATTSLQCSAGNTCLHDAVMCNDRDLLMRFEGKIDCDKLNKRDRTALESAIRDSHVESITALLDMGASVDYQSGTKNRETAIILAINNGDKELVETLIMKNKGWKGECPAGTRKDMKKHVERLRQRIQST